MSLFSTLTTALIGMSPATIFSYSDDIQLVPQQIPAHVWVVEVGDSVKIDTKNNIGYLIHPNRDYLKFPVVTGQNRVVHYIGRTYNAKTPTWQWEVQSMDVKADRTTFGPSGRFLRLYKDGTDRTAYGFHEHRDEDQMFSESAVSRFLSMGCIIVQQPIMDILVETFDGNGSVDVETTFGIENSSTEIHSL